MKWFLVLLLVTLLEAGPTAACSSSCSSACSCSGCDCGSRGLTSVPRDLPTNITELDLWANHITTLNQSDFSRYSSLTTLQLQYNQISVINSGAFYNLTRLTQLWLSSNQLTSLRAGMFLGLDNLEYLDLYYNNIHSIEAGTFHATPQLQRLYLGGNQLTSLRSGMFVGLDTLIYLYLHYNNISSIEAGTFNLPELEDLYLNNNQLPSLLSDMFVGLDNLVRLYLYHNNIHSIEAGFFSATPQLPILFLQNNQLTILRSDMFLGHDRLQSLYLYNNNIHSIEAGTFNATPRLHILQLQNNNISTIAAGTFVNLRILGWLYLSHNAIKTFPSDLLSHLNVPDLSHLRLNDNQLETLPAAAYDILVSASTVNISNNPWQCDCRMLPFKRRMTGSYSFEQQIICAGPANLTGKSLLLDITFDDLGCEETATTQQTALSQTAGYVHFSQVLLAGVLGVAIGTVLTSIICLAIWRIKRRAKTGPAPVPDPSDVSSNPNGAATGPTSGRHHTGQRASPSRAAHSDDGESRPGTSGTVPPPRSLDKSYAVLRAPLPPIKTAGPRGDVRNVPEAAHGDAAANISVPLSRHFIYQQTCPSGLPKGLPGL